jgi:HSP20 family molecular chaperone IbpA
MSAERLPSSSPLWRLFNQDCMPAPGTFVWRNPCETGHEFTLPVGRGCTEKGVHLRVVMPAVDRTDFTVHVADSHLTIRGERKLPEEFGREGEFFRSLPYGQFEKVIELPEGLNLDKRTVHLHHGVLDIHIPFAEEEQAPATVGREAEALPAV